MSIRLAIRYPTEYSEFEIQSFVFIELQKLGYDIRGEVRELADRGVVIFDLVVFINWIPVRIVEIKKQRKHQSPRYDKYHKRATRIQLQVYGEFGVEIQVIYGMKEAVEYVDRIKWNPIILSQLQARAVEEEERLVLEEERLTPERITVEVPKTKISGWDKLKQQWEKDHQRKTK